MTVWAKRDVTVQSTITLYTSTIWEDDMGREIGAATLINHEFQNVSNVSYYIRQAWPVAERTGSLFLSLLNSGSDVVRNVPKRFVSTHREVTVLQTHCQTKLLVVVEQSRRKHRWTNHFQDPLPVYCPQSSEEKMNTCLWTPEKLAECHLEAMNFKENVDFILHTKTIPLLWGRKLPVLFTTALCVCWIKTSRPHN